jgi:hypothetical protein
MAFGTSIRLPNPIPPGHMTRFGFASRTEHCSRSGDAFLRDEYRPCTEFRRVLHKFPVDEEPASISPW